MYAPKAHCTMVNIWLFWPEHNFQPNISFPWKGIILKNIIQWYAICFYLIRISLRMLKVFLKLHKYVFITKHYTRYSKKQIVPSTCQQLLGSCEKYFLQWSLFCFLALLASGSSWWRSLATRVLLMWRCYLVFRMYHILL